MRFFTYSAIIFCFQGLSACSGEDTKIVNAGNQKPVETAQTKQDQTSGQSADQTADQQQSGPQTEDPKPTPTAPAEGIIEANKTYYVGSRQVKTNVDASELDAASVKGVLGDNCNGDVYQFSGEERQCSRGPLCKTPDTRGPNGDYDRLNNDNLKPNPQECMGDGDGRKTKGCAGFVPYCCYMMAATGDYTKCIGYWERLWCSKPQCDEAAAKGATDDQCGGCQCGHAFKEYCGENTMHVPLVKRLKDAGLLKSAE